MASPRALKTYYFLSIATLKNTDICSHSFASSANTFVFVKASAAIETAVTEVALSKNEEYRVFGCWVATETVAILLIRLGIL